MIRSLSGFARLSLRDKRAAVQVLALALLLDAGLRAVAFPTLLRWLGLSLVRRPAQRPTPGGEALERTVKSVDRVLQRWPAEGRCLRRTLVLGVLLREYAPVVRLGVTRRGGVVGAHAWLEIDDLPIGEAADPTTRFSLLSVP